MRNIGRYHTTLSIYVIYHCYVSGMKKMSGMSSMTYLRNMYSKGNMLPILVIYYWGRAGMWMEWMEWM